MTQVEHHHEDQHFARDQYIGKGLDLGFRGLGGQAPANRIDLALLVDVDVALQRQLRDAEQAHEERAEAGPADAQPCRCSAVCRIAPSVVRLVITSALSFTCSSVGVLASMARNNAGSMAEVVSTNSPRQP